MPPAAPLTRRATEARETGLAVEAPPPGLERPPPPHPSPSRPGWAGTPDLRLTVGSRQTASARDWEASRPPQQGRGRRDPQSGATAAVVPRRPCGLRLGGGKEKKKKPDPVNRLTFSPKSVWLRPLPLARPSPPPHIYPSIPPCAAGGCGYPEGWPKKRRLEEVGANLGGLRARPRTTVPSRRRGVRRRLLESGMQNSARAAVMERC